MTAEIQDRYSKVTKKKDKAKILYEFTTTPVITATMLQGYYCLKLERL